MARDAPALAGAGLVGAREQVMMVGDSENDLAAIRGAGIGVVASPPAPLASAEAGGTHLGRDLLHDLLRGGTAGRPTTAERLLRRRLASHNEGRDARGRHVDRDGAERQRRDVGAARNKGNKQEERPEHRFRASCATARRRRE